LLYGLSQDTSSLNFGFFLRKKQGRVIPQTADQQNPMCSLKTRFLSLTQNLLSQKVENMYT
jgi:hypothetical protein